MAFYRETGEVRSIAGMDPKRLDQVRQLQEFLHGADSWSIVVIRHGYLMREFYTFNVLVPTRFDIWSTNRSGQPSLPLYPGGLSTN